MRLPSSRGFSKRALLLAAALLLTLWLLFFDSHSVWKRVQWHSELHELEEENAALRERIEQLESSLEDGPTREDIERIAREKYGMRKPGETVYRIHNE